MDFKKVNASVTTITRDVDKFEAETGNVYQAVMVVAKRANQIALEIKEELNRKLEEFASYTDNLEEIFENREQIEISRFYEKLPKPSSLAIQEYLENKLYFRVPDQTEKTPEVN